MARSANARARNSLALAPSSSSPADPLPSKPGIPLLVTPKMLAVMVTTSAEKKDATAEVTSILLKESCPKGRCIAITK
eukprot:3659420-Rhodomonas_salina.3